MTSTTLNNNSKLISILDKDNTAYETCMTCGICTSRCSWYDQEGGPNPRRMVRLALLGLDDELAKEDLWSCMICNRCVAECPMGIDMELLVRRARSLPQAEEQMPEDYKKRIPLRLEVGNVNGVTKEDYVDTLEWLSEELQGELEDENAELPIDQKGSKYLYIPNPREISLIPMYLVAIAKLFHLYKESWTMSSDNSDVTNWGYYVGDDEVAAKMALQVIDAAENLEIDTLVLSECGHGYKVLKLLAEKLIGRKPKFRVINTVELALEKAKEGVISFDKEINSTPIAYHDPCNLGRKCGLFDEPRELLSMCCKEIVELEPNRMNALCCGGGGGILQDSDSFDKRMISGKAKADQMKAAETKVVATSCLSCHRQLGELSKHYELGMDATTVVSLAAKALKA